MKFTAFQEDQQNPTQLSYDCFTFSGGEEHIRFNQPAERDVSSINIVARLINASAVMRLIVAIDALKRLYGSGIKLDLVCPYFPYARQDRVCVEGEALGASVMASLINSLSFNTVTIWDAHSDVSPALLNNITNVPQEKVIERCSALALALKNQSMTLISPDAGATKKTQKVATYFGSGIEVLQAEKKRDLASGRITHTDLHGDVESKDVLIVDDICDGGRTFIELAKVLKQKGAKQISLYVTHGIFSKGFDVFEGIIDHIYTTDSFMNPKNETELPDTIKLTIVNIED